jgi:peptide chain release factor 3
MKAKHLGRALEEIAEEGGAQVFKMFLGLDFIGGVVGALQFEVLADRIRSEYDLPCHFEATSFEVARWVDADDPKLIKRLADAHRDNIAVDHSGAIVFLARNAGSSTAPARTSPSSASCGPASRPHSPPPRRDPPRLHRGPPHRVRRCAIAH